MQFILYCLCGGLGVSSDFLVYHLSISSGMWYQAANVLGYLSGTLLSFALNRIITFRQRDRVLQRLALFLGVATVGYTASAILLWLLVEQAGLDKNLAKLLTLPMVVVLQFALNRRFTFQSAPAAPAN